MNILTYFDWLRITGREDTKEHYILYLIKIMLYSEEEAKKDAQLYY